MKLDEQIAGSREIYDRAVAEHKPSATVVMLSGGDDSLTTLFLALHLGIKVDYIVHGNTETGLPEATAFAREVAAASGIPYAETDSRGVYEKYVMDKGFIGKGVRAHSIAYHLLKATGFRKAISRNLRKRRRNYRVLCLNGVRVDESDNRMDNYGRATTRTDPGATNDIWVNLIHWWSHEECLSFLSDRGIARSPVAQCLGRSGECMCGTMQNQAARMLAAEYSPEWGRWLDDLEREVIKKFPWGWGYNMPDTWRDEQRGQGNLFTGFAPKFQPACTGCKAQQKR